MAVVQYITQKMTLPDLTHFVLKTDGNKQYLSTKNQ